MKQGIAAVSLCTVLVLLVFPRLASAQPFQQTGILYTVNTTDDASDGACDAAHCSLREAIAAANASAGQDSIAFNIAGPGPHVIAPATRLPAVSDPVILDGATEPDYGGTPVVQLSGANNPTVGEHGLVISAQGSTINGLSFTHWKAAGIRVNLKGGVVIQNNWIGLDTTGAMQSNNYGIYITNHTGSVISGNVLTGNGEAIRAIAISGTTIENNLIGTTPDGMSNPAGAASSNSEGLYLRNSSDNTVRGNVISGSWLAIRIISPEAMSSRNVIENNLIGLNRAGSARIEGSISGISLTGTETLVQGNTIAVLTSGVDINPTEPLEWGQLPTQPTNNRIQGNKIGTDITGTVRLPAMSFGVEVYRSAGNLIGGPNPGEGNLIAGSAIFGVHLEESQYNTVQGNFIGTDVSGTVALGYLPDYPPVEGIGIEIDDSWNNVAAGNLIAGLEHGIRVIGYGQQPAHPEDNAPRPYETANGNRIQGNRIGVNANGDPLGNAGNGVWIAGHASGNLVGGTGSGEGNWIAYNGGAGVLIDQFGGLSEVPGRGSGNTLAGNSIGSNGALGIDLDGDATPDPGVEAGDGITANDSGDGDGGLNDLQNTPALASASTDGAATTITGSLNSTPSTAFALHFYASGACDGAGAGEGERYLGAISVTTNGSGDASFSASLPAVQTGQTVTATATNPAGSTSEFSACVQVTTGSVSQPVQLLVNTSFEDNDDSSTRIPDGWAASYNSGRTWVTCQLAHTGRCAVRMWTSGAYAYINQTQDASGGAGDTIHLQLWARGSNATVSSTGYVRACIYLIREGAVVQTRTIELPRGTYDWRLVEYRFSPTQSFTQIKVQLMSSGLSGSIAFDDVTLTHTP